MSLAIAAFDAKQAFVVSDGRCYVAPDGKKEHFRDDVCKGMELSPRLAIACTGNRFLVFLYAVAQALASREEVPDAFTRATRFTSRYIVAHPATTGDMAVLIVGWCDHQNRMRLAAYRPGLGGVMEVRASAGHPGFAAIGKTEGLAGFLDKRILTDPFNGLGEAVEFAASRDPEIGSKVFGMCYQAPEPFLSQPHPDQVWPLSELPPRGEDIATSAAISAIQELASLVKKNPAAFPPGEKDPEPLAKFVHPVLPPSVLN